MRSAESTTSSQLVAAEIIAEDIVEQHPAEAAAEIERVERATATTRTRVKPGSMLAVRAATEYIYVGKDIRQIVVVAVLLTGIMIVLWLLLVVFRVIPLPFY